MGAGHLSVLEGQEELRKAVATTLHVLRTKCRDRQPDRLVCRGHSGLIVTSIVSFLTGIPMLISRKNDDRTHDLQGVVGIWPCGVALTCVVIDDFVEFGTTLKCIRETLQDRVNAYATCGPRSQIIEPTPLGAILYSQESFVNTFVRTGYSAFEYDPKNVASVEDKLLWYKAKLYDVVRES